MMLILQGHTWRICPWSAQARASHKEEAKKQGLKGCCLTTLVRLCWKANNLLQEVQDLFWERTMDTFKVIHNIIQNLSPTISTQTWDNQCTHLDKLWTKLHKVLYEKCAQLPFHCLITPSHHTWWLPSTKHPKTMEIKTSYNTSYNLQHDP